MEAAKQIPLPSFGYTTPHAGMVSPTSMCAELCKQADSKHTRHHQFPEQISEDCRESGIGQRGLESVVGVLLEIIIAEHLSYALCRLIVVCVLVVVVVVAVVVFAVRSCRCPADNQTRLVAPILRCDTGRKILSILFTHSLDSSPSTEVLKIIPWNVQAPWM